MISSIKKSTTALSALMIMLCAILFSSNEMKAQSIPTDVTTVCNYLNTSTNLINKGTEASLVDAIQTLFKLENFRESNARLNSTSKDKLSDAIYRLVKTLEPSIDPSMKRELREEMDDYTTLGQVIKPFYDSMIEQFYKSLNE